MTDTGGEQERPGGAGRRARGGLGRGLGALIPGAEAQPTEPTRPLDVLFPDLTGTGARKDRGGSAKDLLSPGTRSKRNVSRETRTGSESASAPEAVPAKSGADVSRGTKVEPEARLTSTRASTPAGLDVSRETVQGLEKGASKRSRGTSSGVDVSRETSESSNRAHPTTPEGAPETVRKASVAAGSGGRTKEQTSAASGEDLSEVPGASYAEVPPEWIIPNLMQPRQVFGVEELEELAASIAEVGVLQPVVVRPITEATLAEEGQRDRLKVALEAQPDARYELIMGERRWRAAQVAGIDELPVIVRQTDEDELLREALIENLHRVQLNPIEEAAAYSQLMEDFNYTQEELARKVAKSRPQVANTLRLMKLPPSTQRQLAAGVITAGHARALLGLADPSQIESLVQRIIAEGLSVRATEELVKFGQPAPHKKKREPKPVAPEYEQAAADLASRLDTSVKITGGARKGRVVIDFADQADLARIIQAMTPGR